MSLADDRIADSMEIIKNIKINKRKSLGKS